MFRLLVRFLLLLGLSAGAALAHESRPGYLELAEVEDGRYDLLWKQPARGELRLPIDPVFPEDCETDSEGRLEVTKGALVLRGSLICPGRWRR